MTPDDILRMAREAGFSPSIGRTDKGGKYHPNVNALGKTVPIEWVERFAALVAAAERERWRRIAENAQAVTDGCEDKIDYFKVPSHLMAALALALDEGPSEAAIRARGKT